MFISACLMYEDIEARLLQEKDGIHLLLYAKELDVSISFSYSQMKVLSDGRAALLAGLDMQPFIESNSNELKGALQLKAELPEKEPAKEQRASQKLSRSA